MADGNETDPTATQAAAERLMARCHDEGLQPGQAFVISVKGLTRNHVQRLGDYEITIKRMA